VGTWTNTIDAQRVRDTLDGLRPFDESMMDIDPHSAEGTSTGTEVRTRVAAGATL
jgi:hypothetical protein